MGAAEDTEDARILWEDLKRKYARSFATDVSTLLKQYLSRKMEREKTVIKYTDKIAVIKKKLVAIGKSQSDERKTSHSSTRSSMSF